MRGSSYQKRQAGTRVRCPTAGRMNSPAAQYINGYEELVPLRVGFYPVRPHKSPAVAGKLDREATTNPAKIRFWVEHRGHRSFAMRILKGSQLVVIDIRTIHSNILAR